MLAFVARRLLAEVEQVAKHLTFRRGEVSRDGPRFLRLVDCFFDFFVLKQTQIRLVSLFQSRLFEFKKQRVFFIKREFAELFCELLKSASLRHSVLRNRYENVIRPDYLSLTRKSFIRIEAFFAQGCPLNIRFRRKRFHSFFNHKGAFFTFRARPALFRQRNA